MATAAEARTLFDSLVADFPWMKDVGITPQWIQNVAATSASATEVLAQIRNSAGYARRFPAIRRDDGSLRMTEQQYIQTETSYRSLLRQYDFDVNKDFNTPQSLAAWMKGDIAPDELQDRLSIYKTLKEGSKAQRDAFYIYTGQHVSVDDLYRAVLDPTARQEVYSKYQAGVNAVGSDYSGFITRAAQVAKETISESAQSAVASGQITAEQAAQIRNLDANHVRNFLDVMYTAQDGSSATLSIQELMSAFEYAMIGSAAQAAGLGLPTKERLAQIKAAGVDRAKQIEGYQKFGANASIYNAAVMRARGRTFSTADFEASQFFGDAQQTRDLAAGLAQEDAAGKQQGTFRFDENNGRLVQRGFST